MSTILPPRWDRTRPLIIDDIKGWRAISYLRFSASHQREGDSIERQRINTDRAIRMLGLVLDGSLEDQAKSASKGIHRTEGELGRLLDAIKAGRVPPGTVLIVEAVDRLTREGPLDVYPMLQTIIRAGIVLLVCGEAEDGDEFDLYDEHAINDGKGDKLHTQICSAHQYTRNLSKRAKARHARRRAKAEAGEEIVPNGRPPFWIARDLSARKRGERVHSLNQHHQTILTMFEEAAANKSVRQVADSLTQRGLLAPDGKRWRVSAIGRHLRNDAVLGFWSPIQWINRVRTPLGTSSIVYPEAVPLELWQAVQDRLDERNGVLRGATGKTVQNLFTGHTVCGSCGGPMRIDTGGGIRRGVRKRHLICASYVEHQGCADRNRYDLNVLERPIVMAVAQKLRLPPEACDKPTASNERRAALELRIRKNDEAIAALIPRVTESATLMAHVERLGAETDVLREELRALIEAAATEAARQRQSERMWRLLKETLGPALAGDFAARERLRLLLAAQDYRVVGDGGGRVIVQAHGVSEPVPPYPAMMIPDDEDAPIFALAA